MKEIKNIYFEMSKLRLISKQNVNETLSLWRDKSFALILIFFIPLSIILYIPSLILSFYVKINGLNSYDIFEQYASVSAIEKLFVKNNDDSSILFVGPN